MRSEIKNIISGIIGWLAVQLFILYMIMTLWNLVMPSINIPEVNFLQITTLYIIFKLLVFDWIKVFSEKGTVHKNKQDNL